MQDAELLRSYALTRSQAHFSELVSRHAGLVYSAALRQLRGDPHRAQEVTQMVFLALARKAARLADHPALPAWLHRSTQLAAVELIRRESRRTAHESAAARESDAQKPESSTDWSQVRPILDDTINRLGSADRTAILLRYFSALPYAEIGRRLRLSENASRMRVDRALEKLREQLRRQGITSTSAVLATWLTSEASAAAPASIVTSVAALGASPAAMTAATVGSAAALAFMASNKIALATLGAVLIGASAVVTAQQRQTHALDADIAALKTEIAPNDGAVRDHAALIVAQRQRQQDQQEFDSLSRQLAAAREQTAALRTKLADEARARRSAAGTAANAAAYDFRSLDIQPQPTFRVPPKYPAAMLDTGVTGKAVIDFIVDSKGFVRNAYALTSTNPAFEQSALDAVNAWTFSAGVKSGTAVATHLQVAVVFKPMASDSSSPGAQAFEAPQDWFPPHS